MSRISNYLFDSIYTQQLNELKVQRISIGGWDMDTDTRKDVTMPASINYKTIVAIVAIIIDDNDLYYSLLDSVNANGSTVNGGIYYYSDVLIALVRNPGGAFVGASYNNAGINRGYVLIWYVAN